MSKCEHTYNIDNHQYDDLYGYILFCKNCGYMYKTEEYTWNDLLSLFGLDEDD